MAGLISLAHVPESAKYFPHGGGFSDGLGSSEVKSRIALCSFSLMVDTIGFSVLSLVTEKEYRYGLTVFRGAISSSGCPVVFMWMLDESLCPHVRQVRVARRCLNFPQVVASRRPDPRFKSIKVLRFRLNAELYESLRVGLGFHRNIVSSSVAVTNTWTFGVGLVLYHRWTNEAVSRVVDSILGSGIGTGSGLIAVGILFSLHSELTLSIECSRGCWG